LNLLEVDCITVKYGPIPAVRDVSLFIDEGETLSVVGANGAGKSTLTLAVAGAVPIANGCISFDGKPLTGLLPEDIARRGIALVPEGRHIFEGLTVAENLSLGLTVRPGRRASEGAFAALYEMFPILLERKDSIGSQLSGGEQQQLAIARALLARPRLLILDEPSLGLSPIMVDRVYAALKVLQAQGVSLLLVEQNPERVAEIAHRVMVLANGAVRLSGAASSVLNLPALGDAYLGAVAKEKSP
jgi:branched-chain amino acid transport system ATP-binding protein